MKVNMFMMKITNKGWVGGKVVDTGTLGPGGEKAIKVLWYTGGDIHKTKKRWVEVLTSQMIKKLMNREPPHLKVDRVSCKPRLWTKKEREKYDAAVKIIPSNYDQTQRLMCLAVATGCTMTEVREREAFLNDVDWADRKKRRVEEKKHELEKKTITLDKMAKKDGPVRMR